jgi:hypothetical protein
MTKQEGWIFGLIGVGAIIVLYLLWLESQQTPPPVTGGAVIPASSSQSYPSIPAIDLGNITIGGANPSQVYNTPLGEYLTGGFQVGSPQSDCGCAEADCEEAGIITASPTIAPKVLAMGIANVASFQSKIGGGATSVSFTSSGSTGAAPGGQVAFG